MDINRIKGLMRGQERFEVKTVVGDGTFGTVALAVDKIYGNEQVAIKFVQGGERINKYIDREIENHRKLRHPHVIEFRRLISVPGNLAIVMEFADRGNLFKFVKHNRRLEEPLARWFFQQLIIAVDYCHKKKVASRDIKLENVLLKSGKLLPILKLCDFGYSKHDTNDSAARSIVGSLDYMAPEVIGNQDKDEYDSKSCDIWSCGVVLYVMLVGRYPFLTQDIINMPTEETKRKAIKDKILHMDYEIPQALSPECRDLISRCLTDSKSRITIPEIFEQEWFAKNFPEDARSMNEKILRQDEKTMQQVEDVQSAAEIRELIERAKASRRMPGIYSHNESLDEYIDQILDDEERGTPVPPPE